MFRNVITGVVRHGRKFLEGILQKAEGAKPTQKTQDFVRFEAPQPAKYVQGKAQATEKIEGFLSRYLARNNKENLAAELRRRFSCQAQSGSTQVFGSYRGLAQKLSLYAFVGVGMASSGNKNHSWAEDGFSSVCDEMKGLLQGKSAPAPRVPVNDVGSSGDKWTDYDVGCMIAKGCNAAVYEARLRSSDCEEDTAGISECAHDVESEASDFEVIAETPQSSICVADDTEADGDVTFDLCADANSDVDSDIEVLDDLTDASGPVELGVLLAQLEEFANTESRIEPNKQNRFDLAVKIMFNYEAESCASDILRSMKRELIPAVNEGIQGEQQTWQNGHRAKMKAETPASLPPHPNIVSMWGAFVDSMPGLPEGLTEYPLALPPRLNGDGCGHNKTLFLVMKRYELTLREYLVTHSPTVAQSVLLLTQLTEAVIHMQDHSLAHRDLKSDNILIDVPDDSCPHLVVSDFGCCHDGRRTAFGLRVPYLTDDVCKGGNGSLMAPELSTAQPGTFSLLDFRTSDLWAVGTMAYELFGAHNPFYRDADGRRLDSATYRDEDLPPLPDHVSVHVERIVHGMLHRNPSQRLDAVKAANMLHILLWAPQDWVTTLLAGSRPPPPSKVKVMRWLLQLFAEVTFEKLGQRSHSAEHPLKCMFLGRVDFDRIMDAIDCLWSY